MVQIIQFWKCVKTKIYPKLREHNKTDVMPLFELRLLHKHWKQQHCNLLFIYNIKRAHNHIHNRLTRKSTHNILLLILILFDKVDCIFSPLSILCQHFVLRSFSYSDFRVKINNHTKIQNKFHGYKSITIWIKSFNKTIWYFS